MRRLQLFEWEDQPWLPAVFRDFITDHLRHGFSQEMRRPLNRAIAERLLGVLRRTGAPRIVDLASGAGGPLPKVREILAEEFGAAVEVVLTDRYPNRAAFRRHEAQHGGAVRPRYEPVDARDVPPDLAGLRTLFTAFHHFAPGDARRLLADAAAKRQPLAVFEPLERTPRMLVLAGLDVLWRAFVMTPFVGRLTVPRLLLTYAVPIAPALLLWDALVSVLRSYAPEELRGLARSVGAARYAWDAGVFYVAGPLGFPMPTVYLIGEPQPS